MTVPLEADHLGSTRLVTDANGTEVENTDYLPFGEEILVSSGDTRFGIAAYGSSGLLRHKFTGKERDSESKLDYFLARYYSAPMGRFLSVDPNNADATLGDPRAWNGYAYVRGNPLSLTDPDGRKVIYLGKTEEKQNRLQVVVGSLADGSSLFKDELKAQDEKVGLLVRVQERGLRDNAEHSDADANISLAANGTVVVDIYIDSRRTRPSAVAHEFGHSKDTRINGHAQIKGEVEGDQRKPGRTPHDDRIEEDRANEFRDAVMKEVKATRKAEKQRRREEKRRRRLEKRRKKGGEE